MRRRARERGVAIVTALLLTTLAVSIVASLFWQQQVQVRSMENQRLHLQTKWILRGALDWASVVLRQDTFTRDYTSLDQVWATPLAETRLDQYIERERLAGEQFEATLSGNITDAMSRYNLRNLAEQGIVDKEEVDSFGRLLQQLQMDPALAQRTATQVAASQTPEVTSNPPPRTPGGTARAGRQAASLPMPLMRVEDLLAVPGFTVPMVERLRPFLVVLPQKTAVNVNTAPAPVLAAVVPNLSLSQAAALVEQRKRAPWNHIDTFKRLLTAQPADGAVTVKSTWFLVDSHIRLDRAALSTQALLERVDARLSPQSGQIKVRWIRQN